MKASSVPAGGALDRGRLACTYDPASAAEHLGRKTLISLDEAQTDDSFNQTSIPKPTRFREA
jgi:hypothetical protein